MEQLEAENEKVMEWRHLAIISAVVLMYVLLGGMAFHYLEYHDEQTKIDRNRRENIDFLAKHSCMNGSDLDALIRRIIKMYNLGIIVTNTTFSQSNWDFYSATFFSTQVITTIGYGNIAPSNAETRAFFVFYALFGIPLTGIWLSGIGERMAFLTRKIAKCVITRTKNHTASKITASLSLLFGGTIVFIFVPSIIFTVIQGWTYDVSLYYGVTTLTTVGFGDYVAGTELKSIVNPPRGIYRIGVSVWIYLGLAWLAIVIGDLTELFNHLFQKKPDEQEQEEPIDSFQDDSRAFGSIDGRKHLQKEGINKQASLQENT